MIHHIELYVSDLEKSIEFWRPFMELLNYESERWSEGINFYGSKTEPYLCLLEVSKDYLASGYHRKRIGLNHLAFKANSREHVDEVRTWVINSGYTSLYDDKYPFATAPDYYALFCEDPDRIKLEVVAPSFDAT